MHGAGIHMCFDQITNKFRTQLTNIGKIIIELLCRTHDDNKIIFFYLSYKVELQHGIDGCEELVYFQYNTICIDDSNEILQFTILQANISYSE